MKVWLLTSLLCRLEDVCIDVLNWFILIITKLQSLSLANTLKFFLALISQQTKTFADLLMRSWLIEYRFMLQRADSIVIIQIHIFK